MNPTSNELLKGTLDLLILKTVNWGPMHGYAISRWIREQTGDLLAVEEGALYPALRRLETRGWLASEWARSETGREARFYTITPVGRRRLRDEATAWQRYVLAMTRVLEGPRPSAAR